MSTTNDLVKALLEGHTNADQEAEVIQVIAQMPAQELNTLLDDETADRLFSSVDNRLFGPDNHTRLLEVLDQRRAELDLHALAALVHGWQTGRTGRDEERRIADIFCSLSGNELTHFKNIIALRKDHHDLEGLVFLGIDDEATRQRILDHIAQQAAGSPRLEAKVLSDIDDTVFCKLHDKRYPKGTLYPGVLAFQEALDDGPRDQPLSDGDLTFVTARPGDFFGLVENHSRESLRKAGIADMSLLSGSLFALRTKDAMAGKKIENISHYCQLFPEYHMVWMGDSGQGDPLVGERAWQEFPEVMRGVFIHDVVDTPEDERAEWAAKKVFFHDTYLGAAAKALELGLVSRAGVRRVVEEADEALVQVDWDDDQQRERMLALFERDRAVVEQALAGPLG